ncbi:GDP-mannose mannosyl hydrolase [Shewanella litoralis]|uniref:GDP-mannose mannosyl hydrolase n=1 Tax=Shewanella litoralis TaxID=2282700 RepID=A0ABQ2R6P3_9GAMM|nr:GDP-mannose mannosyl hydrolase [Shewanella litoralis]GGQ16648.1 GDP-mannose mannosyl hydrolase [Shewanella litoralis]
MFLDKDTFATVIASSPLVSIDLVVINHLGQALLGKRLNKPAQDYWFVPGGRIVKNESIADAFKRLTSDELGTEFGITEASLLGPYDHFYDDCVFDNDVSTHYVAIAYVLKLKHELTALPLGIQHAHYQWFDIDALLMAEHVHIHSKNYFIDIKQHAKLD